MKLIDAEDTVFPDMLMSDDYDFIYDCGVTVPLSDVLKVKDEIIEGIITHYAIVRDTCLQHFICMHYPIDAYKS